MESYYNRTCCVCFSTDNPILFDIFKQNIVDNLTTAKGLFLVTGILIHPKDNYPNQICANCIEKLKDAYLLWSNVRHNFYLKYTEKENRPIIVGRKLPDQKIEPEEKPVVVGKLFKCYICQRYFRNRTAFDEHMYKEHVLRKHIPTESRSSPFYKCTLCNEISLNADVMKKHDCRSNFIWLLKETRLMSEKNTKPVKSQEEVMTTNVNKINTKPKMFCVTCKGVITGIDEIKAHKCAKMINKPKCNLCKIEYINKETHMKLYHPNIQENEEDNAEPPLKRDHKSTIENKDNVINGENPSKKPKDSQDTDTSSEIETILIKHVENGSPPAPKQTHKIRFNKDFENFCSLCKSKTKLTKYYCYTCPATPYLHIGNCFKAYHSTS